MNLINYFLRKEKSMEEQVIVGRLKGIINNTKDPGTKRELLELVAYIETGAYLPPLAEKNNTI
jgi:hypothetical protein